MFRMCVWYFFISLELLIGGERICFDLTHIFLYILYIPLLNGHLNTLILQVAVGRSVALN